MIVGVASSHERDLARNCIIIDIAVPWRLLHAPSRAERPFNNNVKRRSISWCYRPSMCDYERFDSLFGY